MKIRLLIFLLILFVYRVSRAASCCGGQASLPDLITGEERYRFSAGVQSAQVIGEAPERGVPVFREPEDRTRYQSLNLSAGALLVGPWQASIHSQIYDNKSLGDTDLTSGVVLSDKDSVVDHDPLIIWLQYLTVPTGKSIYEMKKAQDIPTGLGFYRLGTGLAGFTTYRNFDFSSAVRVAKAFTRSFSTTTGTTEVAPGWGADAMISGGYALSSRFRLGASLQWISEEPRVVIEKGETGSSSGRLLWPVSVQASYFYDMNQTVTLAYVDETLVGPAQGVMLNRSVALNYGYRY